MLTIKKGNFIIDNPDTVVDGGANKKNEDPKKSNSPEGNSPTELDGQHKQEEIPDLEVDQDIKDQYRRTLDKGIPKSSKTYKSKVELGEGGDKAQVTSMWERAKRQALSGGDTGLSEKARRLLVDITSNKPKVNWKKELKKFMDMAFNNYEYRLPNKRTLGRGDITYGRKRAGQGTLKTLVLPVDTSGSITKDMISVFFEETWRLATLYDIDETIIIYASDQIDNVDRVKKGKKPDLTKWASTGGNAGGFHHPFKWMKENKINPSAVIYFTDTWASFPDVNSYGINKYKEKVFWFICNGSHYNKPPFGRSIVVDMDAKGNFT